jgi:peptidoglycan hydrolase FlgJ
VAINPPSDIMLGSMLAADPDKYQAAAARLRRLALAAPPAAAAPASRQAAPLPASPAPRPGAGDAFAQLEAFVLKTFIESMLPANAETAFGKGTAGEIWKSMLAEQLANEMARSGQVGLARRLAQGLQGIGASAAAAAEVSVQPSRPAPALLEALPYLGQAANAAAHADDAPSLP